MELIITEKDNAARRIAEILSDGQAVTVSDYSAAVYEWDETRCIGLSGHVVSVDFPDEYNDWRDVEPAELIEAPIQKRVTRPDIVATVKRLAEGATRVVIATDYDREGELIGKEAFEIVRDVAPDVPVDRVRFSSITEGEVRSAFADRDEIDFDLAAAGEARQIIDLVWGAALTRYLSLSAGRLGNDFISVGRVQSPTLKLIVDREREIEAFDPETYWELTADLRDENERFTAQYFYHDDEGHEAERIWSEDVADEVYEAMRAATTATVQDVDERTRRDQPPHPFNTTQFIRAAGAIGYSAQRAMSIAEELYTAGYITYPRTDNTVYPEELDPEELLESLTDAAEVGDDAETLLGDAPFDPTEGDEETTDHPPIHPTSEVPDPADLSDDEWNVYELVVRRYYATLADPAVWKHLKVVVSIEDYQLKANGRRLVDPGYHAFYPYYSTDENIVPAVTAGQELAVDEVERHEKETQPPRRYGQSRLIETMEGLGVGTKCLTADTDVLVRDADGDISRRSARSLFAEGQLLLADGDVDVISHEEPFTTVSLQEAEGHLRERETSMVSERVVREDETVYRIETDSGSFSVTEDHPLYVWRNDQITVVPASEISANESLVAARRAAVRETGRSDALVMDWEEFAQNCDKRTKLYGTGCNAALADRRAESGETIQTFAERVGSYQSAIWKYEQHDKDVPVWLLHELSIRPNELHGLNYDVAIKNPFPLYWSHELARILGSLLGDGSIHVDPDQNVVDVRYHNTDRVLVRRFAADIESLFQVEPHVGVRPGRERHHNNNRFQVNLSSAVGRVLVRILEVVRKNGLEHIPEPYNRSFVGSIFDDEGHISRERKAFISNTDHELLADLGAILSTYGVETRVAATQHKLHVRGRRNLERFLDVVPIVADEKFYRGLDGLKRYSVTQRKARVLRSIRTTSKTSDQLVRELDESSGMIESALRELREDGHVVQEIEGSNGALNGNRTFRYMATDYEHSIYPSIVGDPNETTVKHVEERRYDGPVYDLTVTEDAPNFALAGGVIVHNSTRHHVIQKLYDRGYIEDDPPRPTELAKAVVEAGERYAELVTSEEMTAQLEADMSAIANGDADLSEVTEESREILEQVFDDLMESSDEVGELLRTAMRADQTVGSCPECGEDLLLRRSNRGSHFIGCDGYPDCEYTLPLPNNGEPLLLEDRCEKHGLREVKMLAGRNTFVHGCPQCRADEANEEEDIVIGTCPECGDEHGGELAIKRLRNGNRLVGCTRYPDCDYSLPLPRRGEIEIEATRCEEHDLPELTVHNGDEPWELGCPICNFQRYQAERNGNGELTDLEGLGDKTAEKLAGAGIESVDDLKTAEADEIASSVEGVSASRIREWQTEA